MYSTGGGTDLVIKVHRQIVDIHHLLLVSILARIVLVVLARVLLVILARVLLLVLARIDLVVLARVLLVVLAVEPVRRGWLLQNMVLAPVRGDCLMQSTV